LICASTEHHAVLNAFEHLAQRESFDVTFLPVDRQGRIDPDELDRAIRRDTTLISVMTANNEIGVLQPMANLRVSAVSTASCCTATWCSPSAK